MDEPVKREQPTSAPGVVRFLAGALEAFAVLMLIPTLGFSIMLVTMLPAAAHSPSDAAVATSASVVAFLIFVGSLSSLLAAGWLAKYLRTRHSLLLSDPGLFRPSHPVKIIGFPVLVSCFVFASLASLLSLLAMIGGGRSSFAWIATWTSVAIASAFALHLTSKYRWD
jgi:hypothetical protein